MAQFSRLHCQRWPSQPSRCCYGTCFSPDHGSDPGTRARHHFVAVFSPLLQLCERSCGSTSPSSWLHLGSLCGAQVRPHRQFCISLDEAETIRHTINTTLQVTPVPSAVPCCARSVSHMFMHLDLFACPMWTLAPSNTTPFVGCLFGFSTAHTPENVYACGTLHGHHFMTMSHQCAIHLSSTTLLLP